MWSDYEEVEEIEEINRLFSTSRARKVKDYKQRMDAFVTYSAEEFRRKYRFSKEGVAHLVDLFGAQITSGSDRGGALAPELQILYALRCWGRNEIQDDCADIHRLSQQSITNLCRRVALAIVAAKKKYVLMPQSVGEETERAHLFQKICGFRYVIGCIDCTHIRIPKMNSDVGQLYINRKNFPSLNVQVVCDATLKISNIVAQWHGSVHDSRIFNESVLKQRFEAGHYHGRLLGDSGYACTPYLLTPLCNPVTRKEVHYNNAHAKTRNIVERCFGVWKSRFQCLLNGFRNNLETTKLYIVALAILHNIAIDLKEKEFPVEEDEEVELPLIPFVAPNEHAAAARAAFIEENF